jgi:hypothetical protein
MVAMVKGVAGKKFQTGGWERRWVWTPKIIKKVSSASQRHQIVFSSICKLSTSVCNKITIL